MDTIVKCPKRQDCHYKLTPGSSGETSINLSNEVFRFLFPSGAPSGTPVDITFRVFKSDAIKALCFIVGKLPLYRTSSGGSTEIKYNTDFFTSEYNIISSFFGNNEEADYHVKLLNRDDGRIYLNGLDDNEFNIRHYLVESNTVLIFARENDTLFLRLEFGASLFEKYSATTSAAPQGEIIVSEKKLRNFILGCVKEFSKVDNLDSLKQYVVNPIATGSPIKIASADYGFSLTGMFIETTKENLEERNSDSERWYSDEFVLDGHTVYLSTQWNASGDYQLTLKDFLVMMNVCYPEKFTFSQESNRFVLRVAEPKITDTSRQKIFFGTPGSGKSHKVNTIVCPHEKRTFRVTFHPDTDYSSFVGSYKPVKEGETLTYEFIPQSFTDAYVEAWKDITKPVFLVIEEINRGNCAQIFGDIFQLLDRNTKGYSEFNVNADKDLQKYLEKKEVLGVGHNGIKDGKLCLPPNLHIFATMNTSDQSLFPMDSAFKRRWEWEYVPIQSSNAKSQFIITIGDKKYPWKDFLESANERIKDVSESEDKQMGNFFIKDNITEKEFVSKVMFYLWSEVCKDEYRARSFFHFKDGNNDEFSFNELFKNIEDDTVINNEILQGFMRFLNVNEV